MKTLIVPAACVTILSGFVKPAPAGVIWQSPLDGNAAAEIGAPGTPGGAGTPLPAEDKNGNPGGAVLFEGNSYFDIGRLGPLNAGSISIWLRQDVLAAERGAVGVGASGGGTDVYFSFMSANGRIRADLDDGVARRAEENNAVITLGQWYHLVVTFDSNPTGSQQLRIYQDGVLQTAPAGIANDVAPYVMTHNGLVGSERTGERFWHGALDDLRIYDNELTQAQVTELFTAGPQFGTSGDTDNDTLPDTWELENGLSATDNGSVDINNGPNGDPDLDGLLNKDEFIRLTRANNPDTDADGLSDKVETKSGTWSGLTDTGTDALNPDTDGDGLKDGVENNSGTFSSATLTGSDPHNRFSDSDLMPDGYEVANLLNPVNAADATADPDLDSVSNENEFIAGTNPQLADTDGDGLKDGVETNTGFWTGPMDTGTNPRNRDTDGDRLTDGVETNTGFYLNPGNTGTDPFVMDTDNDSFTDQTEVVNGSNPVLDSSVPLDLVKTLFVGGGAAATLAGADGALLGFIRDHYGLDAVTYIQSTAVAAGGEEGYDLVFLSSTPNSGDIRSKFQTSLVPVVNCEEAIADNGAGEFGFSSVLLSKSTTTTQMALEDHPITAGLTSPLNLFTGAPGEILYTTALFAGLTPVATAVDGAGPGLPMIYVAEAGQAVDPGAGLSGGTAPARRVQLPFTDGTFGTFTPEARQVVANALDWAVGRLGAPAGKTLFITGLSLNPAGTSLTLTWNSLDTPGQTYDILSSPDPSLPLASWSTAAAGIPAAAGTHTTQSVSITPGTVPRLFFVVREN